ncbi:MAG TPA: alpha/beta hydrolase [Pseudonocardiaceae bacterium]|nr:alpha/beta hydrolase [Pseudonocardiaceae bacterium]
MLRVTGEHTEKDVTERGFELEVAGDRVPGVLWTPAGASGPRPLVLMGHGGSQHKRVDTLLARARHYVRALGFAVAAIDAPDHGDRVTPEQAAAFARNVRERIAQRRRMGGEAVRQMAERARKAVPEWRATLDALQELDVVGADGPVGYWGVSMGTAIGVPFVAAEPRITAAVFGLAGLHPESTTMAEAARRITVPVEFVFQWDDELADREAGLALFDALGSTEKTMHVNPGGHLGIPPFERDSWERFFTRHLTGSGVVRTVGATSG